MKRHTLRFRAVDRVTFDDIRDGRKRVETRAATVKYKNIASGDVVIFVCEQDRFERHVATADHFASVDDMLKTFSVADINTRATDRDALLRMYHGFPGYEEKIKEHGLIALTVTPGSA